MNTLAALHNALRDASPEQVATAILEIEAECPGFAYGVGSILVYANPGKENQGAPVAQYGFHLQPHPERGDLNAWAIFYLKDIFHLSGADALQASMSLGQGLPITLGKSPYRGFLLTIAESLARLGFHIDVVGIPEGDSPRLMLKDLLKD